MLNRFSVGKSQRKRYLFIASLLLPVFAIFIVVRIWPITETFRLSFHHYDMLRHTETYIGLRNYSRLFASNDFILSLKNTVLFAAVTVPVNIFFALGLAMLLQSRKRKIPILEAIYFLPYMVPLVPASIVWKWIYSPNGLLNRFLETIGLSHVAWLTGSMALFSIMILFVWRMNGYLMIIFLVGLRSIPSIYHDAAAVDGSNWWQQTRFVTLPILRPILLYASIMATVWAFMIFSPVYVMSQGSDFATGGSVKVLSLDIYMRAFSYMRMDMACTEAVILFMIILFFTAINLRVSRQKSVH